MIERRFSGAKAGTERYLEPIGGIEALETANRRMDELEPQLASCPFCGGAAMIRAIYSYCAPGVVLECSVCQCGPKQKLAGVDIFTNEYITPEQCVVQAAASWNRRATT